MIPKPNHRRAKPKRADRNKFSQQAREYILQRDNNTCRVCCVSQATQIHHVMYRSRGGRGVKTNGLSICNKCHHKIHKDANLSQYWQDKFSVAYGSNYYKDQWDV